MANALGDFDACLVACEEHIYLREDEKLISQLLHHKNNDLKHVKT